MCPTHRDADNLNRPDWWRARSHTIRAPKKRLSVHVKHAWYTSPMPDQDARFDLLPISRNLQNKYLQQRATTTEAWLESDLRNQTRL
ncbi:hypothetical protein EEB12_29350 [Rhodococcus sp. WS1]|nr:hypothetical protein EEB12_29350 [Rhodococcus sp. WS1]